MGIGQWIKDVERNIAIGEETIASRKDSRNILNEQLDLIRSLYGDVQGQSFDAVSGIYGEEARYKRSLGTNLAAAGSDVGGTYNKLPLVSAGAAFSAKRMQTKNAFEQAKIMNLMNLTGMYSNVAQGYQGQFGLDLQKQSLDLQREAQEYNQQFNIGDLLSLGSISYAI